MHHLRLFARLCYEFIAPAVLALSRLLRIFVLRRKTPRARSPSFLFLSLYSTLFEKRAAQRRPLSYAFIEFQDGRDADDAYHELCAPTPSLTLSPHPLTLYSNRHDRRVDGFRISVQVKIPSHFISFRTPYLDLTFSFRDL